MIEEVKETIEDVREKIGDKWFFVIIAGVVVLFLYFLFKDGGTESEEVYYSPSGVAGYPEVGQNSEVVIDSVNQTIDAFSSEILNVLEQTQGSVDNMQDGLDVFKEEVAEKFESVNEQFNATNDYINDGMDKWNDISSKIDSMETEPKVVYVSEPTTTSTTTTKTETTKAPTVTYYQYQTKKGLNTSTSIVDALKASGVDSSMKNRKKIAEMNGISNYTGTAAQNVTMLNKLKSGTLIKTKG